MSPDKKIQHIMMKSQHSMTGRAEGNKETLKSSIYKYDVTTS